MGPTVSLKAYAFDLFKRSAKEDFFRAAQGLEDEPEGGSRCTECFRLRLEKREYSVTKLMPETNMKMLTTYCI